MDERSVDVFQVTHTLFLALGAGIEEDDAVRVTDPTTDAVLLPLAKVLIKSTASDARGSHHLELTVQAQRGPQ